MRSNDWLMSLARVMHRADCHYLKRDLTPAERGYVPVPTDLAAHFYKALIRAGANPNLWAEAGVAFCGACIKHEQPLTLAEIETLEEAVRVAAVRAANDVRVAARTQRVTA